MFTCICCMLNKSVSGKIIGHSLFLFLNALFHRLAGPIPAQDQDHIHLGQVLDLGQGVVPR